MSLLERTNSISKESPSSLLPEAPLPKRSLFGSGEALPKQGPSSLLPEDRSERYPALDADEVVAVSPSSLLPPPPAPVLTKRMLIGIVAAFGLVGALLVYLAISDAEVPTEQLMHEATEYQAAGNHHAAIVQLKNVLVRDANNVEANLRLGRAFLAIGALRDAEGALVRAREVGAKAGDVVPALAQALIDLGRHDDALKAIDGGELISDAGGQLALLRGRAYLGLGNFVEARTQFNVARAQLPGEAMTELARLMMFEGDAEAAQKAIEEVTARSPNAVSAWVLKGDLLRNMNDSRGALEAYRHAQSLKSDALEAAIGVTMVLIGDGEVGDARKELKKAKAISPSSHLVAFAEAVLALREKRYEDCRAALQAVFEDAPQHVPSMLVAGSLSFETGDVEHAYTAFLSFLNRFPGHVQARKMLAATMLRKRQPEAAVAVVAPFMDLNIRDSGMFAVAGQAYRQVGDLKRAQAVLLKAIELEPENIAAVTELGLVKLADGQSEAGIAHLKKAVALNPKDHWPDRHLAMALLARKQTAEVLALADRLEQRLPGSAEPSWIRGSAFLVSGDKARAKAAFERSLKLDPGSFQSAASLAEMDIEEKDQAKARARFDAVLKHSPSNVDAMLALAQFDAADGKLDLALQRAQRAASDHPTTLGPQLMLAQLSLRADKIDDALTAARRAREINPRDQRALELLGQIQLASGDIEGAVLSFTTLANLRPNSLANLIQLARAHAQAKDNRAAIATARRAVGLAPDNPAALGLLGELLVDARDLQAAISLAEQAKTRVPKRAVGHALEGEVRYMQGDIKGAVVAFERARAIEPSGRLLMRIHQAESRLSGREAPLEGLRAALRASPDDDVLALYLADAMVRQGLTKEAVLLYQGILKRSPQSVPALNNLADALMRVGDPRALDYAQQAFQLRPTDAIVAATLGGILLNAGKLYEAVQVLQKATQLDPGNPEIRFHFVEALLKAGDKARAASELKVLLASGAEFPQIAEARRLAGRL